MITSSFAASHVACRGTLLEVMAEFGPDGRRPVRGEVVLLVAGATTADSLVAQQQQLSLSAGSLAQQLQTATGSADDVVRQLVTQQLSSGMTVSACAKLLSQRLQIPRSKVYKIGLEVQRILDPQQGV